MQHYDIDGNPVSLSKLIRTEPEWAQSQIESLRATISRLKGELKYIEIAIDDDELNLTNTAVECVLKLHASIAEKDSAISRLREYVGHKPDCCSSHLPNCDCGYDDLIKEVGDE